MADEVAVPLPWTIAWSKSANRRYYYNIETKASQFEKPAGTVELREVVAPSPPPALPAVVAAPPVVSVPEEIEVQPWDQVASDTVVGQRTSEAGKAVAEGYTLTGIGADAASRKQSRLFHLRNFNNWVKSTLIQTYCNRRCSRVLDLACGKFGDLHKWLKAGATQIVGIDIGEKQLEDAIQRMNEVNKEAGQPRVRAKFVLADLGHVRLEDHAVLAADETFQAISIQFALHYLFESEAKALTFFRNIADRLQPGGVFIGTLADANMLVRRLRNLPHGAPQDEFGNTLYRVKFYPESISRQWCLGSNPFGCKYNFFLREAVKSGAGSDDSSAQGLDEYLVPPQLLDRMCSMLGWRKLISENFHDYFKRLTSSGEATPQELRKLVDYRRSFSDDEWEVAGLYRVFAYEMPVERSVKPEHELLRPQYVARNDVPAYTAYASPADIIDLKNIKVPSVSLAPMAPEVSEFGTSGGFSDDFVPTYGDDDQDMPSYGVE